MIPNNIKEVYKVCSILQSLAQKHCVPAQPSHMFGQTDPPSHIAARCGRSPRQSSALQMLHGKRGPLDSKLIGGLFMFVLPF